MAYCKLIYVQIFSGYMYNKYSKCSQNIYEHVPHELYFNGIIYQYLFTRNSSTINKAHLDYPFMFLIQKAKDLLYNTQQLFHKTLCYMISPLPVLDILRISLLYTCVEYENVTSSKTNTGLLKHNFLVISLLEIS